MKPCPREKLKQPLAGLVADRVDRLDCRLTGRSRQRDVASQHAVFADRKATSTGLANARSGGWQRIGPELSRRTRNHVHREVVAALGGSSGGRLTKDAVNQTLTHHLGHRAISAVAG